MQFGEVSEIPSKKSSHKGQELKWVKLLTFKDIYFFWFITTHIDIFHFRLKESDLHISVERASEVAKKTEKELFHLFKDTDHKYKNKYRSLIFNLKDTKNNVSMTFFNYCIFFRKKKNTVISFF